MQSTIYHDFESFAASLFQVDARVMLIHDRGQRWQMYSGRLNRLSIHYGLEGGGIICEGATLPNHVVVFVPMQNAAAIIANGQLCDDHCWMLQTPDRDFCYSVSAAERMGIGLYPGRRLGSACAWDWRHPSQRARAIIPRPRHSIP